MPPGMAGVPSRDGGYRFIPQSHTDFILESLIAILF